MLFALQKRSHHCLAPISEWRRPHQRLNHHIFCFVVYENARAEIHYNNTQLIDIERLHFIFAEGSHHKSPGRPRKRQQKQCSKPGQIILEGVVFEFEVAKRYGSRDNRVQKRQHSLQQPN